MLFLSAVICAVDEYQDLVRVSAASAGNDCRLGGDEAPPAILSMFLGDDLTAILESIEHDNPVETHRRSKMQLGVASLPAITRDTTDRNRTSPFAFTGNKFEFRMVGSSFSIAGPNTILNTITAEALRQFADKLEAADDFELAVWELIKSNYALHKRIIFNAIIRPNGCTNPSCAVCAIIKIPPPRSNIILSRKMSGFSSTTAFSTRTSCAHAARYCCRITAI